jgi:hypothetical protein
MDVPKDLPDVQPAPTLIASKNETADDLAIADLGSKQPNILEDPEDDDGSATAAPAAAAKPAAPVPAQAAVPNFRGMSLRAVLAVAAARGLTVQPDGSGIARVQDPPAGAVLHAGERIRVQFAR